jgi:hypothetical protein
MVALGVFIVTSLDSQCVASQVAKPRRLVYGRIKRTTFEGIGLMVVNTVPPVC